jgi:ATP-binding cassette, subfamily B, bacterial PglK
MNLAKKILFLLIGDYKRQSLILIFMMVLGAILEVAGIGLVIPVLGFLSNKEEMIESQLFQSLIPSSINLAETNLLLWGILILILVYLFKTVYLTYLSWRISKIIYGLEESISRKLYNKYLKQAFTFHLENNSGQLIQNVSGEVNQLASIIMGGLNLISEVFVVIGIAILLLIIEPIGTLVSLTILLLFSFVYFLIFKGRLLKWGVLRQDAEGKRIQQLQQGFGGIKDIKLFGAKDHFLKIFARHNVMFTNMNMLQNFFNVVPRYFIELIAVLLLGTLFAILSLNNSNELAGIIPIIGLFAVAAFRLLPSANRILVSIQSLRYASPIINSVYRELNLKDSEDYKNKSNSINFNNEICFKNVCFSYNAHDNKALKDINLNISKGACIGIIGKSGSGKSTLINLLLGLLEPTDGKILIDNLDLKSNIRSWQNHIGYVPQDIFLIDDTLRNNIAFGIDSNDIHSLNLEKAIELSQLSEYINSLPKGLDTYVGERGVKISGGQRQRIGIARALYNNPEIIVLDEATSSLDGSTEAVLMSAVNALQGIKTIIIVAHRLSTIKDCEYIYKLDNGKVINHSSNLEELA